MTNLRSNLRLAAHMFIRRPAPGLAIVAILALAIGATTIVFSIVESVLLRPLPFRDPAGLVAVWETDGANGDVPLSPPRLIEWRGATRTLEGLAAYADDSFALTAGSEPLQVRAGSVTSNFLQLLGAVPAAGRDFIAGDDATGAAPVVILGHDLWQRAFGGHDVIGSTVRLDGTSYEVIGIAPPGFDYPYGVDLWIPLMPRIADALTVRGAHYLVAVGRLRPGSSAAQANAELDAISASVPDVDGWTSTVLPLHEQVTGAARRALLVLLAAVAFVLLIACANVANLLLAGQAARRREVIVRSALGASRRALFGQFITESLVLAFAGGAAGLLLAYWGIDSVLALSPANLPRSGEVHADVTIVGVAFFLSLVTGLLTGSLPSIQASRPGLTASLSEASAMAGGRVGRRVRGALVVAEVALTIVLLAGAGLMVRSFVGILRIDPGFRADRVSAFDLQLPAYRYAAAGTQLAFSNSLIDRVHAIPGVSAAAMTKNLPVSGRNMSAPVVVEGRPRDAEQVRAQAAAVSPEYFSAMSIPLARGRLFDERDGADAPPVAIISEMAADRLFPGEDPIGKRARTFFGAPVMREIVGVVRDVKQVGLTSEASPTFYTPWSQDPGRYMTLVVQATPPLSALAPAVRSALRGIDAEQPITRIVTMNDLLSADVAQARFIVVLLGAFAAISLVLTLLGLYALMAHVVVQRHRELGIRIALGARPANLVGMVVGQGLSLTAAGIVVGVAAATVLTRVLVSLLFGVRPGDPTTLVAVSVLMLLVAAAASYLPAKRAARVDPIASMR